MTDKDSVNRILLSAFNSFFSGTRDFIFVKDVNSVYISASQAFVELAGFSDVSELVGKTDGDLFDDASLITKYTDDDRKVLSSGETLEEYIEPLPDLAGQKRFSATVKMPVRDDDNNVVGILGFGRDITESLFPGGETAFYSIALESSSVSVWEFDIKSRTILQNRKSIMRHGFGSVVRDVPQSLVRAGYIHPGSVGDFIEMYRKLFDGEPHAEGVFLVRSEGREEYWYERVHYTVIYDADGKPGRAVGISEDVTAEYKARQAAEKDAMTQLLNHSATIKNIEEFIEDTGKGGCHALLMVDLDRFKSVNDTFGHRNGDSIISDAASSLIRVFRRSDIIGRVGGDEFMVLMKNVFDKGVICRKAQETIDSLRFNVVSDGLDIHVTASIGISLYSGGDKTVKQLYSEADAALYSAKRSGKGCYRIYSPDCDTGMSGFIQTGEQYGNIQLKALFDSMKTAFWCLRFPKIRSLYTEALTFTKY